ncbi:methyltransferase [Cystobacter fuscus]
MFAKELNLRSQQGVFPREFTSAGLRFVAMENVHSPEFFPIAEIVFPHLQIEKVTCMLEVGAGTGITPVLAALHGVNHVVATDINPAAVENIRANALLHRAEDRVEARLGSVYDPIRVGERFDLIYWNFPWFICDLDHEPGYLEQAIYDPGYRLVRRFCLEAHQYLLPGGRLVMAFSSLVGNFEALRLIAGQGG